MIELTSKQKEFLDDVVFGNWSINSDTGLIDVSGSVRIKRKYSNFENVSFGKITGSFECDGRKLNTLEGCPYWVGGDFCCYDNQLTSLKYAPKYVGYGAYVRDNPLQELDWNPDYIGGKLLFDLGSIKAEYHGIIIPEIEALISKGIELDEPEIHYIRYRDIYLSNIERKLIDLL